MKKLIFKSCVVLAICVFLDPRDFAALVFLTSGIFLPHSAQSLLCCSQPGLGPVRPGFRFRVGYSEWPQPGSWFLYLRANFLSRAPGFLFSHGNSCRADLVSCSELAAALFGFRVICFLLGVRWAGLISRKIFLAASLSLGFLFPASIFGLAPISFGSRPRWFSVAIGFSCSIVPPRRPFSLRARPGLRVLGLLQFFLDEISQVKLPLIFFLGTWSSIFSGSRALHRAGPPSGFRVRLARDFRSMLPVFISPLDLVINFSERAGLLPGFRFLVRAEGAARARLYFSCC
jgi:hypothetical protein